MESLLAHFGLAPAHSQPRLPEPPGSPERCIERRAVADAKGRLWLLERLGPAQAPRREAVARLQQAVAAADPALGRAVPAYRACREGNFVLRAGGACWQLSPFAAGEELPRPGYLDHAWRGAGVADFLLALQRAGAALPALPPAPQADLTAYRDGLFEHIERTAPALPPRLAAYRRFLDGLPELVAAQPQALAHGDLHPLNVVWGARRINAVIDWEFAGARPGLYDAANCLGCAGFEEPSGLTRGFALALAQRLGAAWGPQARLLPDMVLATRLGWLSEWLRKKDAELLDMELDYLDLLLERRQALARLWTGA